MTHAPLIQNDTALAKRPSIGPYGCLFRSLSAIAEERNRQALTAKQIIELYDWLVEQGYMLDQRGKQAWVQDHAAVINAAAYYLQIPQTARYVCRIDFSGQGNDFGTMHDADVFIAQARIEGWNISHFYRADSRGDRVWDPYWPAKPVVNVISLRGYTWDS